MGCKATFTSNGCAGQTLASTLVSIALASLLFAALAATYLYSARSFVGLGNYMEMDGNARTALDTMTADIRQADRLSAFSSNSVSFDFGTNQLIYSLDLTQRRLNRQFASFTRSVLGDCDDVRFEVFQRNPTNGNYDYFPDSGTATDCKVVQVTVLCSRKILGVRANSTIVESAKVVMRNQK